jgi:hypothetical protein
LGGAGWSKVGREYGGPATVGEYAVELVGVITAAESDPERVVVVEGRTGLGIEAEAAVCTESTWADWRCECWELEVEVGGDLRSSFRELETSALMEARLSNRRVQCCDSAWWSGFSVIVVGLVVVRVLAAWWCDWESLQAMNDERRLAVVEGDSRAGDGLDITVASYRGQSVSE